MSSMRSFAENIQMMRPCIATQWLLSRRRDFGPGEDGYAWDMDELAQAIKAAEAS